MVKRKFEGLNSTQKLALIGVAAILVVVLGLSLLFYNNPQVDAAHSFSDFLYKSPKSGIIMDLRNSPSTPDNSVVMQCGINLIADGFFVRTQKDLLVYVCNETGCDSEHITPETLGSLANETNQSLNNTNATLTLVPFDEALRNMRSRAYFHIQYSDDEKKEFHANYVNVFVNSSTDPSECKLNLKKQ